MLDNDNETMRKKTKRPAAPQKSINFADSISQTSAPSMQAPEYNLTSGSESEQENKSFDTQGSITFYVNGFLPERDYLGNESREEAEKQDSEGNGETMHEDQSQIKGGEGYWGNIDDQLEERFTGKEPNADSTFYFDGSAGPLSSAKDRMEYGEAAGQMIIRQLQAGSFAVDENGCIPDDINIVGHSMGGAYAAGLARTLLAHNQDQGKQVFNVRAVYYFAPHQPADIEHPSEIRGVQYSHKNDVVSSDGSNASSGWGIIPKGSGSYLAPIQGIHEFMVHDVPGLDQSLLGDRGGHNVTDHDYTLTKYKPGRDGYIAPNADTDYDTENYNHQEVSQEGYEGRSINIPKIIDKVEGLPQDIRNKISELQEWVRQNVSSANSIFKEKVGQGADWLDEKREDGKEWVDEKINEADEWVDDKVDKGDDFIDDKIKEGSDWLNKKTGGILSGEIGKLSDWVKGKKDTQVDKVRNKENEIVDTAQSKVNEANLWLESKTSDLENWITEKSDSLESWVNGQVEKISSWAKSQISKGEKYVEKTMKSVQRKLKSLIKKIQRKIEAMRKRVAKVIGIIKETDAWA